MKTKPLHNEQEMAVGYDKDGKVGFVMLVSPYCIECVYENDGEQVAWTIFKKNAISPICEKHSINPNKEARVKFDTTNLN